MILDYLPAVYGTKVEWHPEQKLTVFFLNPESM